MAEQGGRFKVEPVSSPVKDEPKLERVPLNPQFPDDPIPVNDNLALFEEEIDRRPRVSQFIATVQNYTNLTQGAVEHAAEEAGEASNEKMGTLAGVYLPTIQNIFGVILFLRFTWIVGLAGVYQAFLLVFICCLTTMLTAFSMSAIATNGVVPAGGAYFMISRALGPEFGGAVGILFYLGTTFGSAMYILGGVEILLKYLAPGAIIHTLGGEDNDELMMLNNMRLYGTLFLIAMASLVFVGVKYVNKAAFFLLVIVLLSITSIYAGLLKTLVIDQDSGNLTKPCDTCFCVLGERLLHATEDALCMKHMTYQNGSTIETDLWRTYCWGDFNSTDPDNFTNCDQYFANYPLSRINGFPGLGSKNSNSSSRNFSISNNLWSNYMEENDVIVDPTSNHEDFNDYIIAKQLENSTNPEQEDYPSWIKADIDSSFTVLLGIFFPSVTGIMAGSNRSGDLKDAQASIPTGTIAAIATTSIVYLSCTVLFGAAVDRLLLLDKFGESLQYGHGGKMVASLLVWPTANFMLIGAFLSTIGAGLQSLTGAPRLLQAIAKDNVIPFLSIFAGGNKNGEPTWALLITAFISEAGILIAELDYVAPILTMFFLMCYMFVNLACVLQIMLRTPSWRPRFKYYHWAASLLGMIMCIALMFICSWLYALIALALAAFVYKYIEYKGAEKEWGDGMKGLQMSSARYALLRLNDGVPHTKNWRPQILLLTKLDDNYAVKDDKVLDFVTQLKAGKGLVMVSSVLQGDFLLNYAESQTAEEVLKRSLKEHQIKGFSSVLISKNVEEGLCSLIQTSGLGGLRHNTVMAGWPQHWRKSSDSSGYKRFLSIVRASGAGHHSLIIPKNVQLFPDKTERIESGTIDVWWIVHDGGLLTLLPYLLKQHKVWKDCRTRIFTVAQMEDNSLQMKQALQTHLYQLRIDAEVKVVELDATDVSAYTYERTLIMEQRNQLIRNLKAHKRQGRSNATNNAAYMGSLPPSAQNTVGQNDLTWTPNMPPPGSSNDVAATLENVQNLSQMFDITPEQPNLRRMHNAVKLNEVIVTESHDAQLVILNLPGPPKKNPNDADAHNKDQNEARQNLADRERNYMEFLEVLTEGLDRVLMVRGGGREVVTIYN